MVELLNFQWIHGEPSKSLDRAGVLVHVFDNTEASEPWLPCPQTSWCARFGDRISASMINQHLPGIFAANGFPPTGIVLSSQLTRVLCSYFADGGSMNKQCDGPPTEGCVPGCIDKSHHWCDSRDVRVFDRNVDVYHCAYRPEDLDAMLQRHLVHQPGSYNELIVDTRPLEPNLPDAIVAVFFSTGNGFQEHACRAAADKARGVYDAFNRRYFARGRFRTPLVSVDLDARGKAAAFRLVAD